MQSVIQHLQTETLVGHERPITGLQVFAKKLFGDFNSAGFYLFSSSDDSTIVKWDSDGEVENFQILPF